MEADGEPHRPGPNGDDASAALASRHVWRQLLAIRDRHLRGSLSRQRRRRAVVSNSDEDDVVPASSSSDSDSDGEHVVSAMAVDLSSTPMEATGAAAADSRAAVPSADPPSTTVSQDPPTSPATHLTNKRRRLVAATSPASPAASGASVIAQSPELRPVRPARAVLPPASTDAPPLVAASPEVVVPAPPTDPLALPRDHPFVAQILHDFGHVHAAPAFLRLHARRLAQRAAHGRCPR